MSKLILFFFLLVSYTEQKSISKEVAIKKAEVYIIENGYSDKKAVSKKITYELLDNLGEKDKNEVVRRRFKTLKSKASFISEDKTHWHIGFLPYSFNLKTLDTLKDFSKISGRSVKVNKANGLIEIAHKTPLFNAYTKL